MVEANAQVKATWIWNDKKYKRFTVYKNLDDLQRWLNRKFPGWHSFEFQVLGKKNKTGV